MKLDKVILAEWLGFFLGVLGLLSPYFIYLKKERLDNTFDKREAYNIDNYFTNREGTHLIFGFDKTEYLNSPTIDENKYLRTFYNLYINEIKRHLNISYQTNSIKYREYCKAKMCADLIKLKGQLGRFSVYFVGDEVETIVQDKEFSESNIKWTIQKIYDYNDFNAKETHLEKYYETIYNLVKRDTIDKSNFVKNVLFTYSDFVQDKNCPSIHSDLIDIETLREGKQHKLGLKNYSIIENLFILPHINRDNKNVSCILKGDGSLYERRTYVFNDIVEGEENGNSIYNLKYADVPIYYAEKENSSPNLNFTDLVYELKLHNQKEPLTDIKIVNISNGKECPLNNTTYEKIKAKGLYAIKFKGSKASIPIVIDIARRDTHVFLELKAEENEIGNTSFKVLAIAVLFSFGVFIPYSFSKILMNVKMYINKSYENLSQM